MTGGAKYRKIQATLRWVGDPVRKAAREAGNFQHAGMETGESQVGKLSFAGTE